MKEALKARVWTLVGERSAFWQATDGQYDSKSDRTKMFIEALNQVVKLSGDTKSTKNF